VADIRAGVVCVACYIEDTGGYMKVLNNYGGLGGNRKLWPDYVQVTMVEMEPDIAAFYKDHYPDDTVIVGDAHQYLLDHYAEFDFIWSSPPHVLLIPGPGIGSLRARQTRLPLFTQT